MSTESSTAVIQRSQYGPTDVRYSDFLKLVNGDKIEKVTFSADGTQLLGVDVDGTRLKIEALPNDPELLSQLTAHKVCVRRENIRLLSDTERYDTVQQLEQCQVSLFVCFRSVFETDIVCLTICCALLVASILGRCDRTTPARS